MIKVEIWMTLGAIIMAFPEVTKTQRSEMHSINTYFSLFVVKGICNTLHIYVRVCARACVLLNIKMVLCITPNIVNYTHYIEKSVVTSPREKNTILKES